MPKKKHATKGLRELCKVEGAAGIVEGTVRLGPGRQLNQGYKCEGRVFCPVGKAHLGSREKFGGARTS